VRECTKATAMPELWTDVEPLHQGQQSPASQYAERRRKNALQKRRAGSPERTKRAEPGGWADAGTQPFVATGGTRPVRITRGRGAGESVDRWLNVGNNHARFAPCADVPCRPVYSMDAPTRAAFGSLACRRIRAVSTAACCDRSRGPITRLDPTRAPASTLARAPAAQPTPR